MLTMRLTSHHYTHPFPAFCHVFYRDARAAELAAAQAATTVDEAQVQALQAARTALKAEQVGNAGGC